MRRLPYLFLLLAGCPPKGGGTTTTNLPPVAGMGCPPASGVFVAVYETPQDGKGHTGWLLPLHDVKGDTSGQEFASIDAAAATTAGVPPAPPSVWLMLPNVQPCKATIGGYYAAAITGATPNTSYGVELSGCAAPADPQDNFAVALVSDQPPTECQIEAPQRGASRLGEMDAQKHWQRPAKEQPIPDGLAGAIPKHDCRPPGCEPLWAITQIMVNNAPVAYAGAVNWLTIPPNAAPETQCEWKVETFAGFFIPGPDGKAVRVDEAQEHPLLLTAALADHGGAHVLLATGEGEYTTYDVNAGKATVGRHLVWLVAPPEAYAIDDRLGPECGEGKN